MEIIYFICGQYFACRMGANHITSNEMVFVSDLTRFYTAKANFMNTSLCILKY